MKEIRRIVALILCLCCLTIAKAQKLTQYVDPRIGSEGEGRVFIGPSAPFGMVKPGPDCVSMPNAGWAPLPEAVKGFTQTHVSGTGGGQKYGNILIQPLRKGERPTTTRGLLLPDGTIAHISVYARLRQKEDIRLGYYSCTYTNGITTEITTSERCAFYRFHHADSLFIDVASFLGMDTIPNKRETQQYVSSFIETTSNNEICGSTTVRGGWNNGEEYTVYFCLPLGGLPLAPSKGGGKSITIALPQNLDEKDIEKEEEEEVTIKIGISYVSIEQARRNISPLTFDEQREKLVAQWEEGLCRVPYYGTKNKAPFRAVPLYGTECKASLKPLRMFYTALYHTLLMPVDKTGEYPNRWGDSAALSKIKAPYYDDYYAIWDTYRTSFPLLIEYYPDRAVAMINSLLNIYQHEGYMPDARSGDCNGRTQGGSNAEVVIAEAFAHGLKGIDYELGLQAMIKDAEVPPANDEREGRGGLKEYNTLGYIPYGIPRAGTRTVEYSYDDWCIAQVAKGLGHNDIYEKYIKRSKNWQNLWRADYEWQGMRGFIMPKDAQGNWLDSVSWGKSKVFHPYIAYKPDTKVAPWNIAWWDTFFYEALSAEYSLAIPHDIPTLINLCGGDSAFRRRLDTFFENGHYNVGNEPSFLTPYLYAYIGRTDLASKRVAQIVNRYFDDTPTGLPGNDDSGAMSAWLIWAMMGKYPATPLALSPEGDGMITIAIPHIDSESKKQIPKTGLSHTPTPSPLAGETIGGAKISFTLNRQYRTWDVGVQDGGNDTIIITCNGNKYITPRSIVDHAKGFCWESPYKKGNTYQAKGTFLFISKDALKSLLSNRYFIYDSITWRMIDNDGNGIVHVRADIDNTEMWIDSSSSIPWVIKMKDNPLGIDWNLSDD